MKRGPNEAGLHDEGYLESELHRIAGGEDRTRYTHIDRLMAESMLILLQRTKPAKRAPSRSKP